MKRNLHSLGLGTLQKLLNADTQTVAVTIGNHVAKQNGHGEVKPIEHHEDRTIPWCDELPRELTRGPVWNQREALRKSMKYLGLVSCPNCVTKWRGNIPLDGKGRVYESYTDGTRWCYVCGTRW